MTDKEKILQILDERGFLFYDLGNKIEIRGGKYVKINSLSVYYVHLIFDAAGRFKHIELV